MLTLPEALELQELSLEAAIVGSHTGIVNSAGEIHLLPRKSGLMNWCGSTRCSIFGCFLGKVNSFDAQL